MTHYCDHEDIAYAHYARDIWVDLGDGLAICASRIDQLKVVAPWVRDPNGWPPFLDELTWGVMVHDCRTSIVHRVGYFWAEADARALARKIVRQMQEVAHV